MAFPLAYNDNGLHCIPLPRAIDEIASAGFDAVELSLAHGRLDPFDFTESHAANIRQRLAEAGITACALATGDARLLGVEPFEPSLIHPEAEGRKRRLDLLVRSMAMARAIGIPVVSFASGRLRPHVEPAMALRWLQDGIRTLLEYAGDDIALSLEPEPGFLIETNAQVGSLRENPGLHTLTLCQDLGHCRVVEDDYLAASDQWLAITRHIQIEDIKGRRHHHEIPGDGDIDFTSFFSLLAGGSYKGYVSVELYNQTDRYREALRRSHDVLRIAQTKTS
ncbi:sugar phosphate isomerase/epimerase family protein [Streptomyces sp. NPDC008001]|uniref:sugar phosphate isomerase/epimerase family protein n=1 Tax=Streptomyces sp. NPDC008001 TaxID=3364804 RepID=UPI0036E5B69D